MTTEPTHVLLIPCDVESDVDDLLRLRDRLPAWVEVVFVLGARGSMMMISKAAEDDATLVVTTPCHYSDIPKGKPSKLVKGVDY